MQMDLAAVRADAERLKTELTSLQALLDASRVRSADQDAVIARVRQDATEAKSALEHASAAFASERDGRLAAEVWRQSHRTSCTQSAALRHNRHCLYQIVLNVVASHPAAGSSCNAAGTCRGTAK